MFEYVHRLHRQRQVSDADQLLTSKALEEHKLDILPLIVSPFTESGDDLILELRHESNNLELFFDLFFIANLSTFTSTHSIINRATLGAYVGLFGILWSTWFQITLHDVRFSIDSMYERACKVIQFVIFVGFAYVGSSFSPGGKEHNNVNFRVLCILLFASRLLFALQYGVALYFIKTKTKALTAPVALTITALVLIAGSFYSMTPAFSVQSGNGMNIYYVWYIILTVEFGIVIALSTIWRQLSFKKTHLVDRMRLLTMIIIGEGAIGVTKTVAKVMQKSGGLTIEGCSMVVCIVLILIFLWMFYFDNHPHHHYGTIRQQFWAGLHFPLHLGIVGVVEGSQQIALSRQIFKMFNKVEEMIHEVCVDENLDGAALADGISEAIASLDLGSKSESKDQAGVIAQSVAAIASQTGICSVANTTIVNLEDGVARLPASFHGLMRHLLGALFQSTGYKFPKGDDPSLHTDSTFLTVYLYYWGSICLAMTCFAFLLWLTRHQDHRAVFFERMAICSRLGAALLAASLAPLALNSTMLYRYIRTPYILPTVAALFLVVVCVDRVGRQVSVHRLKKAANHVGEGYQMGLVEDGHARPQPYIMTGSLDSLENPRAPNRNPHT